VSGVSQEPIVIAHRGASGHRPEHGADAYRLAVELGADAIEPDIVATRDGVLVLRHENEISGTTDVAERSEFADRRTTKEVDGAVITGWFTDDFTWPELSTLRIRERLPSLRPLSAAHDGEGGIQRLSDLLGLLDSPAAVSRGVGLIAEIKHATYFDGIGLPLDELFERDLREAGWIDDPRLTVESFEQTVLGRLRDRGIGGRAVYLIDASGAAFDLVARDGSDAESFASQLHATGLARLAETVHGISVPKDLLINSSGAPQQALVDRAHAVGLDVFTWTLRPENEFLSEALRIGREPGEYGSWQAEFSTLLGTGVDGVFTDFPELAREVLHRTTIGT
jgi:glycerophosphoryl diester phosphodiesterase